MYGLYVGQERPSHKRRFSRSSILPLGKTPLKSYYWVLVRKELFQGNDRGERFFFAILAVYVSLAHVGIYSKKIGSSFLDVISHMPVNLG